MCEPENAIDATTPADIRSAAGPHNPPLHDNCARPVIHATKALSVRDGLVSLRTRSELGVALDRKQSPGLIDGLTRYANKGHIARAALEATAFQTRDVLEAMEKDSGIELDVLRADGGMLADDLLMQFQADILDRPVVRPITKMRPPLSVQRMRRVWRSDISKT